MSSAHTGRVSTIAFEMRAVRKRYPGTIAIDGVDLTVHAGEVHALMGENGAGKSTLMKMIAGSFDDYEGVIRVGGRDVRLHSPAIARANGIQMVHQELNLSLPQSVAENLLAGRLPRRAGVLVDQAALQAEARRLLERVGLDLDPQTTVEELSQHEAQLVEIAKAVGNSPRILVLDEPTSSLGRAEVDRLFAIIRRLRADGLAIIYISHHLQEIFEIADRVTVLRDGRLVSTAGIGAVSPDTLVQMMVGNDTESSRPSRSGQSGAARLRVRGLTRFGFFHDVSFEIGRGEIVGVCGLSGAGRSEIARAVCGIDSCDGGQIELDGAAVKPTSLAHAVELGFAYVTEDRKRQGLAMRLSVGRNTLSAVIPRFSRLGLYREARAQPLADRMVRELQVSPPDLERAVGSFSGGNQQKVLLAKWLATGPKVLMLDEPTRGVDVGAKLAIHAVIKKIADEGTSVLLISSDLPELIALSDRTLVMQKGRVIGSMPREVMNESSLLLAINGTMPSAA